MMKNKRLNPKTIEFFGPPGSGKTTLAKKYALKNGLIFIIINSRRQRYGYDFIYFFTHPIKFFKLLVITVIQGRRSFVLLRHKLHRLSHHLALAAKSDWLSHQRPVVIDEGLAQYFFSVYEQSVAAAAIKNYFQQFVQSDILVFITAVETIRLDRMLQRGRMPRWHANFNPQRWLKNIVMNAHLIPEQLTNPPFMFLFFYTTTNDYDLVVQELADKIRQLL